MDTIRTTPANREKAIETLTNMATIVKRDKLLRGSYFTLGRSKAPDPGALCKGGRACAIGSLFLARGVKLEQEYQDWVLPGTDRPSAFALGRKQADPNSFYYGDEKPDLALAVALAALNQVATEYLADPKIQRVVRKRRNRFAEPIELLFEGAFGTRHFGRRQMLKVISTAKRRIRDGRVQVTTKLPTFAETNETVGGGLENSRNSW